MPLSEHEQRLLDQMERALYAEDPKFATQLRAAGSPRGSRGRAALGIVAVLIGMGTVLAGVATELVFLGVIGFAVMLVGTVIAVTAFRVEPEQSQSAGSAKPKRAAKSGFMDRMEDRWRRRTDEGGR